MEIDFQKLADSEVVDLLIGSDYPELHEVLERRSGPPQTPVAERTPLGWVCVGPIGAAASPPLARRPRVGARASATVSEQELLREILGSRRTGHEKAGESHGPGKSRQRKGERVTALHQRPL